MRRSYLTPSSTVRKKYKTPGGVVDFDMNNIQSGTEQTVPRPTMSHEIKNEPKSELTHDELPGRGGKISGLLRQKDQVKDGDLGARWLEEYTGPRGELNDEENNRIRNKVGLESLKLVHVLVHWAI